jgi:hypothetical protein
LESDACGKRHSIPAGESITEAGAAIPQKKARTQSASHPNCNGNPEREIFRTSATRRFTIIATMKPVPCPFVVDETFDLAMAAQ